MPRSVDSRSKELSEVAESTLQAIHNGFYTVEGENFDLSEPLAASLEETRFLPPDAQLAAWRSHSSRDVSQSTRDNKIIILEISTLAGARLIAGMVKSRAHERIGVLNFASAKLPGGGFKAGAQAQEESLARSSTLFPTLAAKVAEPFYNGHRRDPDGGYFSHAMVYSPGVQLIRGDDGEWLRPIDVDVVTCAAVNAGTVRHTLTALLARQSEEAKIERVMRERMARILYCFERAGVRHLVLGSFGTGVFKNDVGLIARIWAELLACEGSRFGRSFERVVFAVLERDTFDKFEVSFEARMQGGRFTTSLQSV